MKILIIMAGFFPGRKYGGPPVSVDNFCSLMKECSCYIVTHDHDMGETIAYNGIKAGWNKRENCRVCYLSEKEYQRKTFEKIIQDIRPDILYLQGLFQHCVFPCLLLAKRNKLPVLLAPRGELCKGALDIRKLKKIVYIEAIKALGLVNGIHWQSTSDEETDAIRRLMKTEDSFIHKLDNIPSIPKTTYNRRHKQPNNGNFVFISRIHPKKNLLFAISLFKEVKAKIQFDIYGPIEDEDYWKQCQATIKGLPENVKVEYKGLVSHDRVHEIFAQYDAFLFPTYSENYGHVIVESLIVGTPVIISDQTPWRNLRNHNAGWDISLSDKQKYIEAIQIITHMNDKESIETRHHTRDFIQDELRIEKVRNDYEKTLKAIINN